MFGYRYLNAADTPWRQWSGASVINGVTSGIAVSTVTHLLDFVRIHRQMGAGTKLPSYKGFSKTVGKTVVGGATYMPIFDHLKEGLQWNVVSASLASGVLSVTASAPFDYLKQRQIYGLANYKPASTNPIVCTRAAPSTSPASSPTLSSS